MVVVSVEAIVVTVGGILRTVPTTTTSVVVSKVVVVAVAIDIETIVVAVAVETIIIREIIGKGIAALRKAITTFLISPRRLDNYSTGSTIEQTQQASW